MAEAPCTQVGDLIVIRGHRLGEVSRTGEILEILGTGEHQHFRVRWDDDRESIFYPSSDAVIQPASASRRRAGTRPRVLSND